MTSALVASKHPCRCCGHRTLPAPSPTWLTCPVCYWTDEPIDTGAREQELFIAQRSYRSIGAAAPAWLGAVRAPTAEEEVLRDDRSELASNDTAGPSPRERAAAALIRRIEATFGDVAPGDRTTLRAAYRADHFHEPDSEWDDHDTDWRQIPADVLEYFGRLTSVFIFGNLDSFRYYLPAYMRHTVQTGGGLPTTFALDLPLPPGTAPTSLERVAALSQEQREVVVDFLRFVLDFDGPDRTAQRALDRIWLPAADFAGVTESIE